MVEEKLDDAVESVEEEEDVDSWDETPASERNFGLFVRGMKALWDLIMEEQRTLAACAGLLLLVRIIDLAFPFILKLVFDALPPLIGSGNMTDYLRYLMGIMLFISLAGLVIHEIYSQPLFLKAIIYLENLWPIIAQKKLTMLSLGYHDKENVGKKVVKINKGVTRLVDTVANLYWGLLPHLFYLVVNVVIVLCIDLRLGIMFLLPFIPATIIGIKGQESFAVAWEDWEKMNEKANGYFCQSILNVSTVQAFVQEVREQLQLKSLREQMEELDVKVSVKMHTHYYFVIGLILRVSFWAIVFFGVHLVCVGHSSLGSVVYVLTTGNHTISSLWEILHIYMRIMRNLVSVLRMKELVDEPLDIVSKSNALVPGAFYAAITYDKVTFEYKSKDSPVLKNTSLEFKKGSFHALVGPTGCGKTTIVSLLTRNYDASSGSIKFDGVDIRDLDLYAYRRLFAVVRQDVEIFDTTLFANVAYGCPEASAEDVEEAVRAACLGEVYDNNSKIFAKGIMTEAGEKGVRLSGGQRQRIGIARAYLALMHDAEILILDEATSSLDSASERAIQNMLSKLEGVTVIAIAHRLSTIKKADVIYVISDGGVIETGNHASLMTFDGKYADMVSLQDFAEPKHPTVIVAFVDEGGLRVSDARQISVISDGSIIEMGTHEELMKKSLTYSNLNGLRELDFSKVEVGIN